MTRTPDMDAEMDIDVDDVNELATEAEEESKNRNKTKMSMTELINLGQKIYRIQSQPTTNTNTTSTRALRTPPPAVIASPVQLDFDLPPSSTPSPTFTALFLDTLDNMNKGEGKSESSMNANGMAPFIDFNTIPNPTFITGPGIVQSQPKMNLTLNGPRRTNAKGPKLFEKIVKTPFSRWGHDGGMNQIPQLRPISSIHASRSNSKTGQLKIDMEEPFIIPAVKRDKTKFPILNRFSNNHRGDVMREPIPVRHPHQTRINRVRRMNTPLNFGPLDSQPSNTTNASWGGGRNNTPLRRNFIQENITKIRTMRKIPDSKVRPKPLPAIKKIYENIPSTIRSRSRSRSASAQRDDHRRSSSLPISPESKGRFFSRMGAVPETAQSSRPSSVSVDSAMSRDVSPSMAVSGTGLRYTKTRVMPKRSDKLGSVQNEQNQGNTKKFGKTPTFKKREEDRTSRSSVNNEGSTRVIHRKPRSKTRRTISSAATSMRSSSLSSLDQSVLAKKKPPVEQAPNRRARSRPLETKRNRGRYQRSNGSLKQEESREKGIAEILKTESYQALIRNMVKAEMNEIIQKHVEILLKRSKEEEGKELHKMPYVNHNIHNITQPKPQIPKTPPHPQLPRKKPNDYAGAGDSDDDSLVMVSENLTPVYTPPTVYDESLFSIEKWINPQGAGSPYTSAKDTPLPTAIMENGMSLGHGTGDRIDPIGMRKTSKLQAVRFSLPQQPIM